MTIIYLYDNKFSIVNSESNDIYTIDPLIGFKLIFIDELINKQFKKFIIHTNLSKYVFEYNIYISDHKVDLDNQSEYRDLLYSEYLRQFIQKNIQHILSLNETIYESIINKLKSTYTEYIDHCNDLKNSMIESTPNKSSNQHIH